MTQTLHGGCACGAVRYESTADPILMLNCHCRHCQQASGAGYAATVVVPLAGVRFSGEPRYYRRAGGRGAVDRGFCAICGSPIALKLERLPELIALTAGSLDDPALYKPDMDIFTASAQAWDYMHPDLPKRPQGMPG